MPSSLLSVASEATRPVSLETIRADLQSCRSQTLLLCNNLSPLEFCTQSHPEFSPVGWHLGHVAYTESLWIAERLGAASETSARYKRLFAADGLPKAERQNLPSLAEILAYLRVVRSQTEACITAPHSPLDSPRERQLLHWLLQHEGQHAETMAMVLAMHGPTSADSALRTVVSTETDMVLVEAGEFYLGSDTLAAIDNERSAHPVWLASYWLDRTPVTCAQYRQFIEAGGYQTETWWSPAGWQWQQSAQVKTPLYWCETSAFDDCPVCGVSWYEADAYARFIGKRLPTEAEWAKAAGWNPSVQKMQRYPWGDRFRQTAGATGETACNSFCNYGLLVGTTTPVTAYLQSASPYGCLDMLGNVWEWTDTWFDRYPGFRPFPYEGYSQAYFDGAHRVLRGGSWATSRWTMRNSFRNWYHPHRREMFAGFRCAL